MGSSSGGAPVARVMVTAEPILALRKVSLGYPGLHVLADVDLELARGDYLGVVGPNGAGKSTLLLGLLGVIQPSAGVRIATVRVRIGYVPQRGALDEIFPLTVRDIVTMGRDLAGASPSKPGSGRARPRDLEEILDLVGLAGLADRRYRELSGGQKQRVLLARALVTDPELLVLDEPTNGLDLPSEHAIMELVDALHREGQTIVLVTHLLNLVANHARTLALVGDGRVVTGETGALLTGERLATIYGTAGVRVAEIGGLRIVLPAAAPAGGGR
jgi:ABC-type Mn2+/Zn2+ transport system ATPase subunit